MLCVWWNQKEVVYYELLKPGETVNTVRYREQMINSNHALIEKRPEWARRHGKIILQHDNAPAYSAKVVKETISTRHIHQTWRLLIIISSYRWDTHWLNIKTFEDVRKWLDE